MTRSSSDMAVFIESASMHMALFPAVTVPGTVTGLYPSSLDYQDQSPARHLSSDHWNYKQVMISKKNMKKIKK